MVCDGKKWLILDNIKIIKILRGFDEEIKVREEGKEVLYKKYYDMKDMIIYYPSRIDCRYIQIKCVDIEEYKYFYIPHFVDEYNATINLRGAMAQKFGEINNDQNVLTFMIESNQQIQKAFKSNAELGIKQREPQEKKDLIEV